MTLSIGIVSYPGFGGSGVVAGDLAAGLARRGHRVHFIASAPPSRALPERDGLTFHPVTTSDQPLFDHPPYALAVAAKIVEVSRDQTLDVLHVHYAVPHSASAYLARRLLGDRAPVSITTLHGTDVTRPAMEPGYRAITRFTLADADALTVPSEFLRAAAVELVERDVEVIPNFVDTERFRPAPRPTGDPVLFHVSNFRPIKRAVDLIEVLHRVRRVHPARLVLVGDGPELARVRARADELALGEHVTFLGRRDDFADALAAADLFLLPSETESFGLAALEAMSAGVPVLAYRVGGLPEVVVDRETGRLVAPYDVEALARAAIELLDAPEERARLAAGARVCAVERFQLEPALDRYERCFTRALEKVR